MTKAKMLNTKATQNYQVSKHCELFGIVKVGNGYRIVLGKGIISRKEFPTITAAEAYIGTKPYELIINAIMYIHDEIHNNKEVKEELEQCDEKSN